MWEKVVIWGRDIVSIKGTRHGLVIVLDPNRDFEEIRNNLFHKMKSARGFFKGAKFSFFQENREIPTHQKNELENICRQFGLIPNTGERVALKTIFAENHYKKPLSSEHNTSQQNTSQHNGEGEAALMVRRCLRSGQRISYPGHIIVLGDVHPGAEVISGGSVFVIGKCSGVVHAGTEGDRAAKVIALRLTPTVLSIAGQRYSPEQTDPEPIGCYIAHLAGQEIVFERY